MTLPKVPSQLLWVALEDYKETVSNSDVYIIDPYYWHEPIDENCSVCLAGSVIAQSLNANKDDLVSPHNFEFETYNCLRAIDLFRQLNYVAALKALDYNDKDASEISKHLREHVEVPMYFQVLVNETVVVETLSKLIEELEKLGH